MRQPTRWTAQLNGSANEGVDCGVITTKHAVQAGTQGVRDPNRSKLRELMGKQSGGGTNPKDWRSALDHWDNASAMDDEYQKLRYKMSYGRPADEARDWLKGSKGILLGVDYGELARSGAPVGSKTYTGYHAIYLHGTRQQTKQDGSSSLQVKSWDSLFDARQKGIPGPGPVWTSWKKIKDAASVYARACGYPGGTIYGIFLKPPEPWPGDEPDPEPEPDVCSQAPPSLTVARVHDGWHDLQHEPRLAELRSRLLEYAEELSSDSPGIAERLRSMAESVRQELIIRGEVTESSAEPAVGLLASRGPESS